MPKPMLNRPKVETETENSVLSLTQKPKTNQKNTQENKMMMERLMRKQRSKGYVDMMTKLDAGGHVHNRKQVEDILGAIRNEFPEVELQGIMLGIVSACYLGRPYEVHALDITGSILEHYKSGQALPGGLEKARSLAIHGGYSFIEVYLDCCRCVSDNGTVSVVPC